MLMYEYTARNTKTGERVRAEVEAESELAAAKLIHQQGLTPLNISLEGSNQLLGILKHFHRINTKSRVLFSRQLSTLINAGLPLVQSLRSVAEQTESKPLKVVINQLISDVEGGSSLSAAMAKHKKVFNQVYISLVEAGEASGTLDTALERIALQQEKDADIISKVRGAMIYPVMVLFVMLLVVAFMLVKVLPQVQMLYTAFPGSNLPIETRVLLDVSHFFITRWWLVVIIFGVLIFSGTRFARTITGRRVYDTLKLRMPPIATLFQKMYMARFTRTGSTLVAAGVPLLQVLNVTSEAVSNVLLQDSIKKAAEKVKGGKALSDSLQGDPNFLPLVPNMIHIGEESGALEKMMAKCADYYEKEVDEAIKNISTIIEPVMMVLLGVMALIIVAAILLPIYQLAGSGNIQF
ncbi:MAG TPA: type II secretion system F family protein [Candidatus Binatia bacterium]|nr:type II secretion system F family protein [Candidatus Binatia bacterium]